MSYCINKLNYMSKSFGLRCSVIRRLIDRGKEERIKAAELAEQYY